MADVSHHVRDRGQLLLAAAIGLALVLVVLAVLLNTALYTEAISSTSDIEYQERAALSQFDALDRTMPGLLAAINEETDGSTSHAELEATVAGEVRTWESHTSPWLAGDGAAFHVTVNDTEIHDRVIHDDQNETFTDASETTGWTVAENVSTVSMFRLTVSPTDLYDTGDETCDSSGPCFQFSVEGADGTTSWVSVFTNNTADVALLIEGPDGRHHCPIGQDQTTIDVVNTSIDGSHCDGLDILGQHPSPYTIAYENGDRASGAYILAIDGTHSSSANFTDNTSPRVEPGVHRTELLATYESSTLVIERTIVGEADQ